MSLLTWLGIGGKKKLSTRDAARLKECSAKLRGADQKGALDRYEALLNELDKDFDVSEFRKDAEFFRARLYPKG